ncbi:hypothetical protein LVB77_14810 [Lysobacter sp. 5GHs7-4]|uniref:hypothetical protein n=1 Tax=Lysobacter sp. 5GHs7-4 TaxID=2904253 RepID=UPI001E53D821|nr:hypothetical protein [Lysobacter sp. 5GHs7-4]UHQ21937.1 hypothetical protein LVB77_14810 [Lysobacter sp. 5GHs7-4]
MGLPYENSSSGNNAITEIQKMLRGFGCTKFGTGEDFETGELFVQFEHRGRQVFLKASARGYAAAWLKEHPFGPRTKGSKAEHQARALKIGGIAVYSILRDWVKGQVTAIEIGMLSFEAAFLSHIMLPSGVSVIEHIEAQRLLPSPSEGASNA